MTLNDNRIPRILGPADQEAIERFSFLRSGQASEADRQATEAWRASDTVHDAAWSRVSAIWEGSAAAAGHPAIAAMRSAALAPPPRRTASWRPFALAASLVLALTSALWIGGGGLLDPGASSRTQLAEADWAGRVPARTRVGEIAPVRLDDGSVVTLSSNSAVRTALSPAVRRVRLDQGEAFFKVAKDAERPFTVYVGDINVTALGTAFSVAKADAAVIVTLVEGSVRVVNAKDGETRTLVPGSQLRATSAGFSVAAVDAARATSWVSGMLDFDRAPLSDVVGELNRYAPQRIILADPGLAAIPVSGLFRAGDQDRFVETLVATGRARVARRTDDSIELRQP
ncbi:FecR family protein [Sphingopyxis sp. LARHCG72]